MEKSSTTSQGSSYSIAVAVMGQNDFLSWSHARAHSDARWLIKNLSNITQLKKMQPLDVKWSSSVQELVKQECMYTAFQLVFFSIFIF